MNLEIMIQNFILEYGLFSIFFIVALEYANFPLPSEIVLPFAGILAFEYDMNISIVIFISILGGVFGSLTNYYIGYKFGNPLLFKLKEKYPKTQTAIRESNNLMEKYDKFSVLFSRLIPLARTIISIVAGVNRMNIYQFIGYSTVGITIWNIFLITIGYIVGDNMDTIGNILSTYTKGVVIFISIGLIGIILLKKNKKEKLNDEISVDEEK